MREVSLALELLMLVWSWAKLAIFYDLSHRTWWLFRRIFGRDGPDKIVTGKRNIYLLDRIIRLRTLVYGIVF
jgi:hypothetical protein